MLWLECSWSWLVFSRISMVGGLTSKYIWQVPPTTKHVHPVVNTMKASCKYNSTLLMSKQFPTTNRHAPNPVNTLYPTSNYQVIVGVIYKRWSLTTYKKITIQDAISKSQLPTIAWLMEGRKVIDAAKNMRFANMKNDCSILLMPECK